MIKKSCPRCSRSSYSACREGWICPYCKEDLSSQPSYGINDDNHVNRARDEDDGNKNTTRERLRLVSGSSHN